MHQDAQDGKEDDALREASSMIQDPMVSTYYVGRAYRLRGDLLRRRGDCFGAINDYQAAIDFLGGVKLLNPDKDKQGMDDLIEETRQMMRLVQAYLGGADLTADEFVINANESSCKYSPLRWFVGLIFPYFWRR